MANPRLREKSVKTAKEKKSSPDGNGISNIIPQIETFNIY